MTDTTIVKPLGIRDRILRDIYELPDKNDLGDVTEEELTIIIDRNLEAHNARIRAEALEDVNMRLLAIDSALRSHHKFQSEFGTTYTKDDEGNYHEIDLSDGYADSALCELTCKALKHSEQIRALAKEGQEQ